MKNKLERYVKIDNEVNDILALKDVKPAIVDELIASLEEIKEIIHNPHYLKRNKNLDVLYSLFYLLFGFIGTIGLFSLCLVIPAPFHTIWGLLCFIPGILTVRLIPDFVAIFKDYDVNQELWHQITLNNSETKLNEQINKLTNHKMGEIKETLEADFTTPGVQMSLFTPQDNREEKINDALIGLMPEAIPVDIISKEADVIGITYLTQSQTYLVYQTNFDGTIAWSLPFGDALEALSYAEKFYLGYAASNMETKKDLQRARVRNELNKNWLKGEK